jgi:hypothetical protein
MNVRCTTFVLVDRLCVLAASLQTIQMPENHTFAHQLFEVRTYLQNVLHTTHQIVSTLPQFIPSHSDARAAHLAKQVEAACVVLGAHFSSPGIGKLLGPTGGTENWGHGLLQVLEFTSNDSGVAPAH